MKFFLLIFHKTPLYMAVEKGNIEIVEILASYYNFEINDLSIIFIFYF